MSETAPTRSRASGFAAWRRGRPFVGGLLLVLSGLEIFFSGQLDLGNIRIQLGFEGFQATVIPALLALLGVLVIVTPAQRMFYGIFALILAVYSLVGVNLGGFFVGMLLGAVGGVMTVAWRPNAAAADPTDADGAADANDAADAGTAALTTTVREDDTPSGTLRSAPTRRGVLPDGDDPSAEPRPFVRRRPSRPAT